MMIRKSAVKFIVLLRSPFQLLRNKQASWSSTKLLEPGYPA